MTVKLPREPLVDRVLRYTESLDTGLEVISMARLGTGIIAVHDDYGDCEVYFDASKYRPKHRDAWGENDTELFPPKLKAAGMGLLRGPHIANFEAALGFALQTLEPTTDTTKWYEAPVEVKLD